MSEENAGLRCPCGDVILADTEDWPVPLCYNCYPKHLIDLLKDIQSKLESWDGIPDLIGRIKLIDKIRKETT